MFCAYFTDQEVHDLNGAMRSDRARFAKYFHGMLAAGVYLAPSQFEAGFLSLAHTSEDLDKTVSAAGKFLRSL
jgi:glutamate-1-semialdehyde 2,1-aminomutase